MKPKIFFQEEAKTSPCFSAPARRDFFRKVFLMFFFAMLLSPIFVFAALPPALQTPYNTITTIFNGIVVFLIGLAFIVFLWGVYKYVTTASLDGKEGARATIIYGLIGLFVMLAAWGLVNILLGTFGFTPTDKALNRNKIPEAVKRP